MLQNQTLTVHFTFRHPHPKKNWFLPWSGFEPTSPWLLLSLNVFPSYFFSIKIKLPKKTFVACYGNILNKGNKIVSRLELSSWPCERKLNLKLSIFQPNRTSASAIWKHNNTRSISTSFDIKFLENDRRFNRGVT